MVNRTIHDTMREILFDPELLETLYVRRNEYGDRCLDSALYKISHGMEIAKSFGFDETVTMAILMIKELAMPNFNDIGEAFLQEVDPYYTRALYGRQLTAKLLAQLDSDEINTICDGVVHAIEKTHSTPEEKIAQIIDTGFSFSITLKERSTASLFNGRYKDKIMDETAKAGVLTEYVIPENTIPRRERIAFAEEEKQRRKKLLCDKFAYYLSHPDEIPEAFRHGWNELDEHILTSYYVVSLKELNEDDGVKKNWRDEMEFNQIRMKHIMINSYGLKLI